MNKNLRTILDELYALDPELKTQEKELLPILEKLLKMKPDAEPDPAFVQKLRVMLNDKTAERSERKNSQFSILNFSFLSMPKYSYAITGAVLGAVLTGPIVYTVLQQGGIPALNEQYGQSPIFSYAVEETGDEAFGSLTAPESSTMNAYGRGGGGMGGAPEIDAARPQSGGGNGNLDAKMIAPGEITQYNLKFEGELPALTAQQVEVLKRQRGASTADMNTILRSFNTGLIDLSSFGGAKTDMLSFYQDTPYGYIVTVSFREGTISLNANWEKWPHPEANCTDEACYRRYQLKAGDVPADDVLLNIAKNFVAEHTLDLSQYGEPEVDNQWRIGYDAAVDKSTYYIPDQMRVVYPQLVDGKPIFDEGGGKVGVSFGINAREKKVSDMWGLMDQKLLKSNYDAVTDSVQITDYLSNFGKMDTSWMPRSAGMPEDMTVKQVDVTLGTPEMGFVKIYHYEENTPGELIVPALIFPVTNVPEGSYFYRTSVTVPLAKELLEKMNQQGMPMPTEPIIMEDMIRE